MTRKLMRSLLAAAALAPLAFAALPALADTTISSATSTPLVTSTAGNITINSGDSISFSTSTPAITINSADTVTNNGTISITNVNNASGIYVIGAGVSTISNVGAITVSDTTAYSVGAESVYGGAWANYGNLYGIYLAGTGAFTGEITNSGTISIKGNNSSGIEIASPVVGDVINSGTVSFAGDANVASTSYGLAGAYGIHIASTGSVTGNVTDSGVVTVTGQKAIGIGIDGAVGGTVLISGSISSTAFRLTSRPSSTTVIAALTSDQIESDNGAALEVSANVGAGVVINATAAVTDTSGNVLTAATEGSVVSYGSAPAILISGGANNITIGNYGTGANAYGFVDLGTVTASGIFDGVPTTAIQIGGTGTGSTNLSGGIYINAAVTASSYQADAIGLHIGGSTASTNGLTSASSIFVDGSGSISASTTLTTGLPQTATAILIEQSGSVGSIVNQGVIQAGSTGLAGNAVAIRDLSGTVTSVSNDFEITAALQASSTTDTATSGTVTAIDLSHNTTGATITQTANPNSTTAAPIVPEIIGNVLFGSGTGTINDLAGTIEGDVTFGGNGVILVDNGAFLSGGIHVASGSILSANINNGLWEITNTPLVNMSSLTIGASGQLVFGVNPQANGTTTRVSTLLNVSGTTTIANGATFGLWFDTPLTSPQTYTVVQSGALISGVTSDKLLGFVPWIYAATPVIDTANNEITIAVVQKTPAQIGLEGGRGGLFNALYQSIDSDPVVFTSLQSKYNQASFDRYYNQFLPYYTGATFYSIAQASRVIMDAEAQPSTANETSTDVRAWVQEVSLLNHRDGNGEADRGYDSSGVGFVGGLEDNNTELGTVGIAGSFNSSNINEEAQASGALEASSALQLGAYLRSTAGPLNVSANVMGGWTWFKTHRVLNDYDSAGDVIFTRANKSVWSGATLSARLAANYDYHLGPIFIRPEGAVDYTGLFEQAHSENYGSTAFDLHLNARNTDVGGAETSVTVGTNIGAGFVWTPQFKLGVREAIGDIGATTGRFMAGTTAFSLTPNALGSGSIIAHVSLIGSGGENRIAIEAGGEVRKGYTDLDVRVSARTLF